MFKLSLSPHQIHKLNTRIRFQNYLENPHFYTHWVLPKTSIKIPLLLATTTAFVSSQKILSELQNREYTTNDIRWDIYDFAFYLLEHAFHRKKPIILNIFSEEPRLQERVVKRLRFITADNNINMVYRDLDNLRIHRFVENNYRDQFAVLVVPAGRQEWSWSDRSKYHAIYDAWSFIEAAFPEGQYFFLIVPYTEEAFIAFDTPGRSERTIKSLSEPGRGLSRMKKPFIVVSLQRKISKTYAKIWRTWVKRQIRNKNPKK